MIASTEQVKCEFTGRLYLIASEQGVQAWCRICRRPHMLPRLQVLALLLSDEEKHYFPTTHPLSLQDVPA